jgi:hypothetical protein
MKKADKLIVSHKGNIKGKYGKNASRIFAALKSLRSDSQKKGLKTEIIFLDDAAALKKAGGKAVLDTDSAEEYKTAVDSLYKYYVPDYMVLTGAQDIIPFQDLKNPAFRLDEEPVVPSDLPYACEHPFSTDPKKFLAPTRVVGRIPDIPNGTDPAYFENIIKSIIKWKPRPLDYYQKYFALSTVSWKGSTTMNVKKMFGNTKKLLLSPLKGPEFAKTVLKPATHFINCHGALEDPFFYGEKGDIQPEALFAKTLSRKIAYGTIVAAECCFGAQLYDPDEVGHMSIANSYLLQGAIAFMGSTNVAYGPEDNIALADLITQYFLTNVFECSSTGRALLEARIKFLEECGPYLDVMELKTVLQFLLLGDPSIHPVVQAITISTKNAKTAWMSTRANRRENLQTKGMALQNMIIPPKKTSQTEFPEEMKSVMKKMLKENNMTGDMKKQVYVNADKSIRKNGAKALGGDVQYVACVKTLQEGKIVKRKILMVKKRNNTVLGSRVYVSK